MKITITNDDGEVYVVATNVKPGRRGWVATDEEGDESLVVILLEEGAQWERHNEASKPQPVACVLGSQRVNSTAGYCTAHGARWVDDDPTCWGVKYYGAPAVPS